MNPASSDQIINFYKHIANQQATNFSLLETILIGLTVILVGASWLWNFKLAKNYIRAEVERQTKKFKKTIRSKTKILLEKKIADIEKSQDKRYKIISANVSRSFAIHSEQLKYYGVALGWWFSALDEYRQANTGDMVRICVDSIQNILKKHENALDELTTQNGNQELLNNHQIAKNIPSTLSSERNFIANQMEIYIKKKNIT